MIEYNQDYRHLAESCEDAKDASQWWIMAGREAFAAWVETEDEGNMSAAQEYFAKAIEAGNVDGWAYLAQIMDISECCLVPNALGHAVYTRITATFGENATKDDLYGLGIMEGSAKAMYFKALSIFAWCESCLEGWPGGNLAEGGVLAYKLLDMLYDASDGWVYGAECTDSKVNAGIPEAEGLYARILASRLGADEGFEYLDEEHASDEVHEANYASLLLMHDSFWDWKKGEYTLQGEEMEEALEAAWEKVRRESDPVAMYAIAIREEDEELRERYLKMAKAYGSVQAKYELK